MRVCLYSIENILLPHFQRLLAYYIKFCLGWKEVVSA